MLFIDYSSAFNTIVPSKFIINLAAQGLNPALCNWVLDFLWYSMFTNDASNSIKFADDTTVVGLITNDDETAYREEVRALRVWCQRR
jgi:hypothetical protein